jgi:hypothetical protein
MEVILTDRPSLQVRASRSGACATQEQRLPIHKTGERLQIYFTDWKIDSRFHDKL